jgi:Transposase DDE domain
MPSKKRSQGVRFRNHNPDLRRQVQMPGPEIAVLEQNLQQLLRPEDFLPIRQTHRIPEKLRRDRLLTLPVMLAVVLGLIYRKIPGLAAASRVLWDEGLLWVAPLKVSRQALSKRLMALPVRHFVAIFEQVLQYFQQKPPPPSSVVGAAQLRQGFSAIWIADGSTLEELRKRLKILADQGTVLAGRMMMVVDLFTHRPVASWYTDDATANDKQWLDQLIERLPQGGLLVFDLGFFKFPWFDQFTTSGKYFITRQREKTTYTVQKVFSSGSHYRDEQIQMGQYRSNPCEHPVRMVSVLWGAIWYSYLTNVLDPDQLSAQQVCDLYRRRWRIEDAFALTKRLLGLAYLWVGNTNGVEIQVYATWIFYALINDLCVDVAIAMNQPLEVISLEMVFRGLYHFNNFQRRGEANDVIDFLSTNAKRLGILKAKRPRQRQRDDWSELVWGSRGPGPIPLS